MARNGFKWIDSDMHLAEPGDLWDAYIDPKYRDSYRQWTKTDASFNSLLESPGDPSTATAVAGSPARGAPVLGGADSGGQPHAFGAGELKQQRYGAYIPYLTEDGARILPEGQLRAMDTEGIDVAVLFPTVGGRGWREAPNEVSLALCRAYNQWLHDFCQHDPGRLKVNALVPLGDVDAAMAELNRAVTKLGAVGVSPGSSRRDVRLDDPRFEPFWAEAERLNVAVTFHGSAQLHLQQRYPDHPLFNHATGRGIEHPLAFMELLGGGVFERHPNLRCVFLEAGCSWIIYWLFRLEEEWERYRVTMPNVRENVKLEPIEYWRRQCWSGVEVDEWPLRAVIDLLGDDNLVLSSDFPHFDSAFPEAFEHFMAIPGVSDDSRRKVLWTNCARLYGITG
ncbi:MAG: amidohydrolase family protein [Chloroflexi bacterium]|nr:amidohydrolase family protein [Chloroflexota bacterium]